MSPSAPTRRTRLDDKYVRRRIAAATAAVVFLGGASFAVSQVGGLFGSDHVEAAPARPVAQAQAKAPVVPTPTRTPKVAAPKPSPAVPQGGAGSTAAETALVRTMRLTGNLTPKSVVASPSGLVVAQNMMYSHSVAAFGADGALLATIKDSVDLAKFGIKGHPGTTKGAPVEAAFTKDGKHAWISNYSMYGAGYGPEGLDSCRAGDGTSTSTVYRVDTATFAIDRVVEVGAVPKYVAVTPDDKTVLVTNWCSWDLSVIDIATNREVSRIPLGGAYPRGIVVAPDSRTAYVALMGSDRIVTVDLRTKAVKRFATTGNGPRHIVLSPDAKYLYVTNNGSGTVAKLDRSTGAVLATTHVGNQPRSLTISSDGTAIYSVNYESSTVSKMRTSDLKIIGEVATDQHPIGITYEPTRKAVWVACYGGSILVFDDSRRPVA
ncbi:beta-propeller fold lactonase family protein [Pedococcus sp. KACC 23699]|uniref:Beta-propeller fold lactonase family protein n=1 Tax=Pedococcus sp. KACC 23699 TaxID=3149228 RepID=A0AAU7JWN5_9MICO